MKATCKVTVPLKRYVEENEAKPTSSCITDSYSHAKKNTNNASAQPLGIDYSRFAMISLCNERRHPHGNACMERRPICIQCTHLFHFISPRQHSELLGLYTVQCDDLERMK